MLTHPRRKKNRNKECTTGVCRRHAFWLTLNRREYLFRGRFRRAAPSTGESEAVLQVASQVYVRVLKLLSNMLRRSFFRPYMKRRRGLYFAECIVHQTSHFLFR